MKFLDQAKIMMQSGEGGAGCCSFHREKFVEYGGPDGGNGGRGGDIIIECAKDLNTLVDFRYAQHFIAEKGHHGMGRNRTGADGKDLVVRVPIGTEILSADKEEVLMDLTTDGQRFVFLKGGDGGFGNAHYKTATNQAPEKFTKGWPCQEIEVWLRLKLIADGGIIGLPNAGKSTFLAASSAAKPKIADYPFTTLHPNLGVVKIENYDFILADIPGLIEGAHQGLGLGDRFLGHVERTAVLVHLIDITQDDPVAAYHIIRNELSEYGEGVAEKEEIICLNKTDTLGKELSEDIADQFEKSIGVRPHLISGVSGDGVRHLLFKIADVIRREKQRHEDEETGKIDHAYSVNAEGYNR